MENKWDTKWVEFKFKKDARRANLLANLKLCQPINEDLAERVLALVRESKKNNPEKSLSYAEARQFALTEEAPIP